MQQGGKCVAIVPMSCALAQSGKVLEFKKKVMESHTLEGVFSMPDELFFNSKVGVVSCIMIFTAKRPHPLNKKTYFGYYKDDGFVKRKTKGRIDLFDNFKNTIKQEWIDNYQNHESVPGLSINRIVKPVDEWCAEAYMQTDYYYLGKSDFEKSIRNYAGFLIINGLAVNSNLSLIDKRSIPIDHSNKNWKEFMFEDLFKITGSRTTSIHDLEDCGEGKYPFVTTQATNNGVEGFYGYKTEDGNVLTIDSAVLGYCTYQPNSFTASDHVEKLIPKFSLNKYLAMFLTTIINKEQYRYNYGRKASQTRLKERSIKLPTTPDGEPDWQFMEDYIKSLPYSSSI